MFNSLNSRNRTLQDQLVLFSTGLSCLFMFPFSIYRFLIGDYVIGAIDLMIALGLITIFSQSWRSKKVKYLNTIAVIGFMLGVSWVMNMRGLSMIFWAFPTIGFTYFVIKSKEALTVNILFISGITFIFFDILTKSQILSIYPSLILVCLFGFGFSLCSESQNKNLLKLVSEDTLTGIKNRRSFDEKIEEILANHKRNGIPVSMLLLDLDFFKRINDSYGHKQGDKVLIDFAKKVKSIIRTTDYIYRFGGEEFVVIANNSALDNSGKLAESIREFIVQSSSLSKYNMTVSIGVSEVLEKDDADSWFRRADRALYEAKESGRNKVCLAKLDESKKVYCEAISQSKHVKSITSSTNDLIRPQSYKNPNKIPTNYGALKLVTLSDEIQERLNLK